MSGKITWEDRTGLYHDEKGKKVLCFDHPIIGRWYAGPFKPSESKAAGDAFRRGMELGMRRAHAEMESFMKGTHEVPDIEDNT
jgi:hypothetical protein